MSKISQLISCIFLMILSSQSWSVVTTQIDSYQYGANVDVFVEYVELTQKNHVYDGTQNLLYCCYKQLVNAQDLKIRDGSFFASSDGFFATKSVKPSLSTLHTRGTKIPGGRKIGDTLAGSNKIKNSNGDIFKRVDFAPSKPHNGLSPHTHPNFRNQLPDGTIRSGVSRNAGPVTRRDIIDAARQGGQRTGGL